MINLITTRHSIGSDAPFFNRHNRDWMWCTGDPYLLFSLFFERYSFFKIDLIAPSGQLSCTFTPVYYTELFILLTTDLHVQILSIKTNGMLHVYVFNVYYYMYMSWSCYIL